jgi:hypothetical protein
LSFFLWPMCCLSFDLLILITHLVSSNSSYLVLSLITRYKAKLSEPMHLLFDILFYSRLKLCSIITFYSGRERVIQCLYNDAYVVKMTYLFRWVLDQLMTSEFSFSIFKHSLIAQPTLNKMIFSQYKQQLTNLDCFYCIKFDLPSDSYLHFNGMRKEYFGCAIKECLKILKENSDVINWSNTQRNKYVIFTT